jgi:hypothetical protein
MSLYRLLQALSTGAATFGLSPTLPPVESVSPQKTPAEAFAEDGMKLRLDFDRAFVKMTGQIEARGQSIEAKAGA